MSDTILCESCGYPLAIPVPGTPCPECGTDTGLSLPTHRPGSPWQQSPSLTNYLRTNWLVLRRPRALFGAVSIRSFRGRGLLNLNLLVTAFLLVDPWTGVLVSDPTRAARGSDWLSETMTYAWVLGAQVSVAWLLLFGLTWLEMAGMRWIGARRGWRVTRDVAFQVCAHASVGWIFAAVFPLLSLALGFTFVRLFPEEAGRLFNTRVELGVFWPWGSKPRVQELFAFAGLIGGFLAGLLVFETLVYIGVRKCRFANTPSGDLRAG